MTATGISFLVLGVFILVLAGVGLYSLPDALSRQHAATKAGALGLVSMLAGTALLGGDMAWGGVPCLSWCWCGSPCRWRPMCLPEPLCAKTLLWTIGRVPIP